MSEAVALGQVLEDMERKEAKKRQKEGGRSGGKASGKLPEAVKSDTRDKVGLAVGMSGKTYEKAKAIVKSFEALSHAALNQRSTVRWTLGMLGLIDLIWSTWSVPQRILWPSGSSSKAPPKQQESGKPKSKAACLGARL